MAKEKKILISYVIPHYNSADFLAAVLAAIRSQDFDANIEILLVDNNSDRPPRDIAKKFGARLVKESKQGPSAARNRGITEAKGEFIAFLDSDIVLAENWAHACISAFQKYKWIDCVQSPIVPASLRPDSFMAKFRTALIAQSTGGSFTHLSKAKFGRPIVNSSAFMVRRTRLSALKIRFCEDLDRCEDMDFTRQMLYRGAHFLTTASTHAKVFDRRSPFGYLVRSFKQGYFRSVTDRAWFARGFELYKFATLGERPNSLGIFLFDRACGLSSFLGSTWYFVNNLPPPDGERATRKVDFFLAGDPRNRFILTVKHRRNSTVHQLGLSPFVRMFLFDDYAVLLNLVIPVGVDQSPPFVIKGAQYRMFLQALESRKSPSKDRGGAHLIARLWQSGFLVEL